MSEISTLITLTNNAISKVKDLIAANGNHSLKLRVYILGGGCSGFQYGFTLDATVNEDDIVISEGTVTVLVDTLSAQYLMNAKIDYTENLQGARFIVLNPNAETTCGCGSSFSIKEELF
jgi:iron-sulfur cluster insertion protein